VTDIVEKERKICSKY